MKKRIITAIGIALIGIVLLYMIVLWKIPIYYKLNHIQLPAACKTYKTKVVFSDVYYNKILGEKVVITDLGIDELETYIKEHNSEEALTHITVTEFSEEWDDWVINPSQCKDRWDVEADKQYYVIRYCRQL